MSLSTFVVVYVLELVLVVGIYPQAISYDGFLFLCLFPALAASVKSHRKGTAKAARKQRGRAFHLSDILGDPIDPFDYSSSFSDNSRFEREYYGWQNAAESASRQAQRDAMARQQQAQRDAMHRAYYNG